MYKKFYVLVDKHSLKFHEFSGNTTDDITEAFKLENLEEMKKYRKNEFDENAQDDLKIYEVCLTYYVNLVEGE